MIDFMADIPKALQAKYKALSDEDLQAAYYSTAPGEEKDAIVAELFRRRREELAKIPREERHRRAKERFVLRKEDITIIGPGK